MCILAKFRNKNVNFRAKNNGQQNFTQSLGIPNPPPYLGIIPKKNSFFLLLPLLLIIITSLHKLKRTHLKTYNINVQHKGRRESTAI